MAEPHQFTSFLRKISEKNLPRKIFVADKVLPPDRNLTYFVPDVFRVYICLSGSERFKIPSSNGYKTVLLQQGDAILAYPNCCVNLLSNGLEIFHNLGVFFTKKALYLADADVKSWPLASGELHYPVNDKISEYALIYQCLDYLEENKDTSAKTQLETTRFIMKLLPELIEKNTSKNLSKNRQKELNLGTMVSYIKTHYFHPLERQKLAKSYKISESTISAFFKKNYHTSFKDFITSLRMSKACELLLKTDAKVKEIAQQTGYQFSESFIQKFRKIFKISPLQLRKTALGKSGQLCLHNTSKLTAVNLGHLPDKNRTASALIFYNAGKETLQLFKVTENMIHLNLGKVTADNVITVDCQQDDVVLVKSPAGEIVGFTQLNGKITLKICHSTG